jgi:hypothetical protein
VFLNVDSSLLLSAQHQPVCCGTINGRRAYVNVPEYTRHSAFKWPRRF